MQKFLNFLTQPFLNSSICKEINQLAMKKIFLLCMFVALLWSCEDDDNVTASPSALRGTWNLVNVSGGITGSSFNFPPGTIKWKFNDQSNTVNVVNNNPADSNAEDFFETGTYSYVYTENEVSTTCVNTLTIDNVDLGCQHISGQTMTLTQVVADGYVLTLKR
jgi:hypothetical protein